jgi:hypothetical protein
MKAVLHEYRPGRHPAITSCVTRNVRLPRRRSPASYCAQFLTLNFIFGMWCRRLALCLFGMARIGKALGNPRQPTRPRRHPCNNAAARQTPPAPRGDDHAILKRLGRPIMPPAFL